MDNEVYEFIRIIAYPLAAMGVIALSQRKYKTAAFYHATALYFLMWAGLLVVLHTYPDLYRPVSNFVSTPALLLINAVVWLDIYINRGRA